MVLPRVLPPWVNWVPCSHGHALEERRSDNLGPRSLGLAQTGIAAPPTSGFLVMWARHAVGALARGLTEEAMGGFSPIRSKVVLWNVGGTCERAAACTRAGDPCGTDRCTYDLCYRPDLHGLSDMASHVPLLLEMQSDFLMYCDELWRQVVVTSFDCSDAIVMAEIIVEDYINQEVAAGIQIMSDYFRTDSFSYILARLCISERRMLLDSSPGADEEIMRTPTDTPGQDESSGADSMVSDATTLEWDSECVPRHEGPPSGRSG